MWEERIRDWLAADLADIARLHMPFGKFGPDHFPPHGVPLYDLGELLRILHQLKTDGCDEVFDEFRRRRGGRTSLREPGSGQHG
jgi:uncharacterized protein (DUF3820 family)